MSYYPSASSQSATNCGAGPRPAAASQAALREMRNTVTLKCFPILGMSLSFTVVVTLLLIRAGQGGSRLAGAAAGGVIPAGDRTADRYWKLGLFYVNGEDPVLMVEKRFGIGYTINFGHPGAWLVIGTLVAVAIVLAASRLH